MGCPTHLASSVSSNAPPCLSAVFRALVMTAGDQSPSTPPQPPPLLTVGAGEGAGRYVLEFAPGGVVACQRDEIHSSPTPTHHPANPVNSKNFKYPTRPGENAQLKIAARAGGRRGWPAAPHQAGRCVAGCCCNRPGGLRTTLLPVCSLSA